MKTCTLIFFVVICVCLSSELEAECVSEVSESTPRSRFTDNLNGTITDDKTGLVWMRCSLGQTWNKADKSCRGEATRFSWLQAHEQADSQIFSELEDWRLPNYKELVSIVERSCYRPAINLTVFPNTPQYLAEFPEFFYEGYPLYWTSTPSNTKDYAFSLDFTSLGFQYHSRKDFLLYVRLVRQP